MGATGGFGRGTGSGNGRSAYAASAPWTCSRRQPAANSTRSTSSRGTSRGRSREVAARRVEPEPEWADEHQPADQVRAEGGDFEPTRIFKFYYTDPHGDPDVSLAAARLIVETYGGELNATCESDNVSLQLTLPTR